MANESVEPKMVKSGSESGAGKESNASGGGAASQSGGSGLASGINQITASTAQVLGEIMKRRQEEKLYREAAERNLRKTKFNTKKDQADYLFEGIRRGNQLHMGSTPRSTKY